MKINKKAVIIVLVLLLMLICNSNVYAEDELVGEPIDDEVVDIVDETLEPNLVDRIYEWFENNMVEFLTGLGTILSALFITVIIPYLRSRIAYIKSNIDEKISDMSDKLGVNTANVSNIVDVVNRMISAYNTVEEKLKLLENTQKQDETNTAEVKILAQTITEILTTVYANSKNLPQGVKDMISLKYSQALKSIDEGVVKNDQ